MNNSLHPMIVLLRLVRFSPLYFLLTVLYGAALFVVLPIPLGLASRAFFDALSGSASAGLNVWSAIALLVSIQAVELFVGPALGVPWSAFQEKSRVLLQRNLFEAVLRGYGSRGLPVSVGEAISRFRDDPQAKTVTDFRHNLQPIFTHALKSVRRCARLVRAAAEEACAAFGHALGNCKSLLPRFNGARAGYDTQVASAKTAVASGKADYRIVFFGVAAYQLVRLADLYDFLHAGHLFQRARLHGPFVARNADGRALRPGDGMRAISQ